MPNRAIEFHGSTFDGVEREGADLSLRFSAAYIHQSEGKPGVDAGSRWVQELRLHISDASLRGEIVDLSCDLWDGSISLDDQRFDNCVPIPLDSRGRVEVNLEQDGKLTVIGTRVRVDLLVSIPGRCVTKQTGDMVYTMAENSWLSQLYALERDSNRGSTPAVLIELFEGRDVRNRSMPRVRHFTPNCLQVDQALRRSWA